MLGRKTELGLLHSCLEHGGPWAMMVHGLDGLGKTTLLQNFTEETVKKKRIAVLLDCRNMEPTEQGFLDAIAGSLSIPAVTLNDLLSYLESENNAILILLDHYEVFRLLDSWMRQTFIPVTAGKARLIMADRQPPIRQWLTDTHIGPHFRTVALGPLSNDESGDLLAQMGVKVSLVQKIADFSHGHPLALQIAGTAALENADFADQDLPLDRVLSELTQFYLADIRDPGLREAIEAAALVRRINEPMLAIMTNKTKVSPIYDRLGELHFMEHRGDGLSMHEAVRDALVGALRARDPVRFREMRKLAWILVRAEIATAPLADLWRCTADMIYLIDSPIVREAFFPSGVRALAVEPACAADETDILSTVERYDLAGGAQIIKHWWSRAPGSFHVVRNFENRTMGFYLCLDVDQISKEDCYKDPVTAHWIRDLDALSRGVHHKALFLRRWLSNEEGELPSRVQAACWLDAKRTYMEMRPDLGHVYLTVSDLNPFARVATQLGFVPMPEQTVELDGIAYQSARLDFGPGSVDGWIAGILSKELGMDNNRPEILDVSARQLLTDKGRENLTPLEFGVMRLLLSYPGEAVSRERLLDDVWGIRYEGGSNVVDTVVGALRKKLGTEAALIESVRGVGYRIRREV